MNNDNFADPTILDDPKLDAYMDMDDDELYKKATGIILDGIWDDPLPIEVELSAVPDLDILPEAFQPWIEDIS